MKNFNICGVYWKIRFLGRLTKNQYRAGDCLKTGVCKFKGGLGKKEGGVFEGGWYPNAHYENGQTHLNNSLTIFLSVFNHFVGLELKGLKRQFKE